MKRIFLLLFLIPILGIGESPQTILLVEKAELNSSVKDPTSISLVSNKASYLIPKSYTLTSSKTINSENGTFIENIGYWNDGYWGNGDRDGIKIFYGIIDKKINFEEVFQVVDKGEILIYHEQKTDTDDPILTLSLFKDDIYIYKTWVHHGTHITQTPALAYFCKIVNTCISEDLFSVSFTARGEIRNIKKQVDSDKDDYYLEIINTNMDSRKKLIKQVKQDLKNESTKQRIDLFKKECEGLGFKPGTKKFKDCVVELME